MQIMLWAVPELRKAPLRIKTMHRANIFGVQFLPQTGNTRMVSCAMDHTVQMHLLERADVESWSSSSNHPAGSASAAREAATSPRSPFVPTTTRTFHSHTNRVKVWI